MILLTCVLGPKKLSINQRMILIIKSFPSCNFIDGSPTSILSLLKLSFNYSDSPCPSSLSVPMIPNVCHIN